MNYYNFVTSKHELYGKYYDAWQLAVKSYWGGVEYRDGEYLKKYSSDSATASDVINTYDIDDQGRQIAQYKSNVYSNSKTQNETENSQANNFYYEKLENVPVIPLTRLYVSEYNSILFRNPPYRYCGESTEVQAFMDDVTGDGESINEFMSTVDTYSTVYGVIWISCIKPAGAQYPRWRMHSPLDVTNWRYRYDANGELTLAEIQVRISSEPDMDVYQYISEEFIDTIFMPHDQDVEIEVPAGSEYIETPEEDQANFHRVRQINELGYVPVTPVYQSNKIHNGIGHTPMHDISQIQRSVYNDFAELYSSIAYGAHPVTVVDQRTLDTNQFNINAEPGAVIAVETGLAGESNYVFEFKAPPLDSITEIRDLIEQKIQKMHQVAMIRSEDIIKSSTSGAHIDAYDSKLEAFIRKKATSLENAEANRLWPIWFDWQGIQVPDDMSISYNRQYSRRALETELAEIDKLLTVYERYTSTLGGADTDGRVDDIRSQIASRFEQLLNSSYTDGSL